MTVTRSEELDINGIPKLVRNASGVSESTSESKDGSVTGTGLYDGVNTLINLIKAPGELFIVDKHGINHGVIFVGIIGTILAITGIALGGGNLPVLQVDPTPTTLLKYAFF